MVMLCLVGVMKMVRMGMRAATNHQVLLRAVGAALLLCSLRSVPSVLSEHVLVPYLLAAGPRLSSVRAGASACTPPGALADVALRDWPAPGGGADDGPPAVEP